MSGDGDEFAGGGSAGVGGGGSAVRIELIQPGRDMQSNFEVDLAKKLEEYLVLICSGTMTSSEQEQVRHSVNFAEAALLIQGSVQVYSKKVEYLYTLVIRTLEFLSQKRQQEEEDQQETEDPNQPTRRRSDQNANEEEGEFLGLDDVPADPKANLDIAHEKESWKKPVKPPANLIVMEGDCLDTTGADEIESYLLATCEFFKDFLLLDPCDAGFINDVMQEKEIDENNNRGTSIRSKKYRSGFKSPTPRKSARKVNTENQNDLGQNQNIEGEFEFGNGDNLNNDNFGEGDFDMGPQNEPSFDCFVEASDSDSDSEANNPWKPLNPHEPGSLRIKPFKKLQNYPRPINFTTKRCTLASQFPLAKFEPDVNLRERPCTSSESPPPLEKLLKSLIIEEEEEEENNRFFGSFGYNNNDNHEEHFDENNDFDMGDADMANNMFDNMDADLPPYPEKESGINDANSTQEENFHSRDNLEDLCRSHLDKLLSSVMDSEKQSEIASRVSSWKDRIEFALEEQDGHRPFDIHLYGENIKNTLSSKAQNTNYRMSFAGVVNRQPKHEVARTFSALLQLVNGGKVHLEKPKYGRDLVCHTGENPFFVRLIGDGTDSTNIQDFEAETQECANLDGSGMVDRKGKRKVNSGKGSKKKGATPEGKKIKKAKKFVESSQEEG